MKNAIEVTKKQAPNANQLDTARLTLFAEGFTVTADNWKNDRASLPMPRTIEITHEATGAEFHISTTADGGLRIILHGVLNSLAVVSGSGSNVIELKPFPR